MIRHTHADPTFSHANSHSHDHSREHRAHAHTHGVVYPAYYSGNRGIWALKISFIALLVTAVFQIFVYLISGSVALLADTIHNFGDALTAIPLAIAFMLAKRSPTWRFTFGSGQAEDLTGLIIYIYTAFTAMHLLHRNNLEVEWTTWEVIASRVKQNLDVKYVWIHDAPPIKRHCSRLAALPFFASACVSG